MVADGSVVAGRYRVVEELGRGGMGVVYRAVDTVLRREVALKELRTFEDTSGEELTGLRERMRREARAAARVQHEGVVAVYDVVAPDDAAGPGGDPAARPVIVMELVNGPSLDDVLRRRGALPPDEAAAIGAKVADALGAAHEAGVLHRDVKPGNILLGPGGRVVLTDFGIATVEDPLDGPPSQLTRDGQLVGSLDFLAPERAQGMRPGPASDVWSLGAMLYAAVEGTAPFRRESTWSTLNAIVTGPPPRPRAAGPLGPVLRELLAKEPSGRPDARSASRMLAAVGGPATVAGGGAAAGPTRPLPVHPGGPADHPAGAAAGGPAGGFGAAWPRDVPGGTTRDTTRPEPGWRPPTGPTATGVPQPAPPPQPVVEPARAGSRRLVVGALAAVVLLAGGGAAWAMSGGSGSGRLEGTVAGPKDTVVSVPPLTPSASASAHTRRPAPARHTATSAPRTTAPAATSAPAPKPKPKPTAKPAPWASCTYYSGTALTEKGDSGPAVKEVQCILVARGFGVGAGGVDGQFGPDTLAAVKRFQTSRHIEVDGQVGPQTWGALRS